MTEIIMPTGTVEGDKAAVIAAALAAKNAGEKTVRLGDGHWLLDYLTPTDIYDRYLIMEHGTFSTDSWVYPFKPDEWARRTRTIPTSGGRGRIALELDDTIPDHWRYMFPVAKDLGVPITVAWHTGSPTTGWVHEAYRHGWGVMSHLPGDYPATEELTKGTLDDYAQQSLAVVRELVGDDVPVGFVYPRHDRSVATDEVLRKYYSWGRGLAMKRMYSREVPTPWLVASYPLDSHFSIEGISAGLKRVLREVAQNDAQMSAYFHVHAASFEAKKAGLEALVEYARALGIEFVTSNQLYADNNLVEDPYFDGDTWRTTNGAVAGLDDGVSYHGSRSIRFEAPSEDRGSSTLSTSTRTHIPTRPGMFTKLRVSFRINNDTDVNFTSGTQGVTPGGTFSFREIGGGLQQESGVRALTGNIFPAGEIPAGEWVEYSQDVYVNPAVETIGFALMVTNIQAGNGFNVDEFRVQHIGWAREYVTEDTLTGTAARTIRLPIAKPDMHRFKVEPAGVMSGELTVEQVNNVGLRIRSSSSLDTMPVRITVEPRQNYYIDE